MCLWASVRMPRVVGSSVDSRCAWSLSETARICGARAPSGCVTWPKAAVWHSLWMMALGAKALSASAIDAHALLGSVSL